MGATVDGDIATNLFRAYTETFMQGMSFQYFLLCYKMLHPASGFTDEQFITAALEIKDTLEDVYEKKFNTYYSSFKMLESGEEATPFTMPKKLAEREFIKTLMINGPQALKQKAILLNKKPEDLTTEELEDTFNRVSNQLAGKTVEAPRANQQERITRDTDCVAAVRVPNSGACNFCQMLASRGPVYKWSGSGKSKTTAKFAAHSSCGCHAQPVYKGYSVTKEQNEAADKWLDANSGKETKARRTQNNKQDVADGLLRAKTNYTTDPVTGNTVSRTTYVKTQKAKDQVLAQRIAKSKAHTETRYNAKKPQNAMELNPKAQPEKIQAAKQKMNDEFSSEAKMLKVDNFRDHKVWAKKNGVFNESLYTQKQN